MNTLIDSCLARKPLPSKAGRFVGRAAGRAITPCVLGPREPAISIVGLSLSLSIALSLSLVGCDKPASTAQNGQGSTAPSNFLPKPTTPVGQVDATYSTRAQVIALPGPNRAKQFLQLHHEVIPEFANRDGKVVGMKEMIMDFPDVARGDLVKGINVGDFVRVTFEVRWKNSPRTLITAIEPLSIDQRPTLLPIIESGGEQPDQPTQPDQQTPKGS